MVSHIHVTVSDEDAARIKTVKDAQDMTWEEMLQHAAESLQDETESESE